MTVHSFGQEVLTIPMTILRSSTSFSSP